MADFERLVEEILKQKPEVDRATLSKMIEEKKRRVGAGYLTDQGALFLVASDLGVSLDRVAKSDMRIKGLYVGASGVTIRGRVLAAYPPKKYTRKNGLAGSYRRLVIFDQDASIPVTLWEEKAETGPAASITPGNVVRIVGGYVRAGLDGEPVLNVGNQGEVQLIEDEEQFSIPSLEDMVREPSSVKTVQKHLCIEGAVKSAPRASQFVGRDGSSRTVVQFHLAGSTGTPVRVALWNPSEQALSLEANTRIRLVNLRSKILPHGETEFHGDEGTWITIVSPPPKAMSTDKAAGIFRLLSYGLAKTGRDGSPTLNALVTDSSGRLKRLVAKGSATERLVEVGFGSLFECSFRNLDDKTIICDQRESIKTYSGEAPLLEADAYVEKVRNVKPQGQPAVFEVIALSRTVFEDITTKDGSSVKKAELLVGDETGEIKVVAWRDLVEIMSGIVPGQRLRLSFVEPYPGRDGAPVLQVRAYSQIVRH